MDAAASASHHDNALVSKVEYLKPAANGPLTLAVKALIKAVGMKTMNTNLAMPRGLDKVLAPPYQ